jgi:hypothetical protein
VHFDPGLVVGDLRDDCTAVNTLLASCATDAAMTPANTLPWLATIARSCISSSFASAAMRRITNQQPKNTAAVITATKTMPFHVSMRRSSSIVAE